MKAWIVLFTLISSTLTHAKLKYDVDIFCQDINVLLQKINVISENIANKNTTRTKSGSYYRRKVVEDCLHCC